MTLSHQPQLKLSTRWIISGVVFRVYICLAIVDKDTHSIRDIINARIVPAFFLYCLPGYFISKLFVKHFSRDEEFFSIVKPLMAGVFVSFLSMMALLVLLKQFGIIPAY
jgi:hypothetical protein